MLSIILKIIYERAKGVKAGAAYYFINDNAFSIKRRLHGVATDLQDPGMNFPVAHRHVDEVANQD